jgi:hypothetical protein
MKVIAFQAKRREVESGDWRMDVGESKIIKAIGCQL